MSHSTNNPYTCRCVECRYLRVRMLEEMIDEIHEMFRNGIITRYVYESWSKVGLLNEWSETPLAFAKQH